ncbi:PREDICTED: uncharacterized protein LOC104742423 isoform X1 [Camelina sativa]|uniref:Uncharacterized protein LOC104742423 isoform X1 n=1 Tax=Camelina sativa TaxID=90675 RepID=A0ABM0VVL7_CAMSA|nr:PREDICTED: uncharacterized protein LOC104742423 isoform X1 [Camelina sativa]
MDNFHNQICLLNLIFEFQANHRRRWYYLHIAKQLQTHSSVKAQLSSLLSPYQVMIYFAIWEQVYSLDERGIFFKTMILNRYPDCEYISFYTLSGLGLNASTTAANLSKEEDQMFASCRFSEDSAGNELFALLQTLNVMEVLQHVIRNHGNEKSQSL